MRARALLVAALAGLLAWPAGTAPAQAPAPGRANAGAGASVSAPRGAQEADAQLRQSVRRAIAAYFGVPVDDITDGTDLFADLHADATDAYEILAMLCREHGVAVTTRVDLTTVGAIVDYLRTAPAVEPAIALRGDKPAPGAAAAKPEQIATRVIFYATDRRPTGKSAPDDYFGGERQAGGTLSYGVCEVTIPVGAHRPGTAEEPEWYKLEWNEDPAKHVVLKAIRPLERATFFNDIRGHSKAAGLDTFVFVHGYNVAFGRAARRAAQISYDLDFPGVPILFSWPSAAKMTAYFSDRESAEWSAPHLAQFLEELGTQVKGARLHLLAHSMGNQVLIRALNELALRRGTGGPALFDNVILAAPDFDAQAFVDQIAPRVVSLSRRWTIYASDKDRALDASAALAAQRLGLPLPVARGIDTIDASGIDVAPWSVPEFHTYFASKQRVIVDLQQVLRGLTPERRRLLPKTKNDLPYWSLQPVAGQ